MGFEISKKKKSSNSRPGLGFLGSILSRPKRSQVSLFIIIGIIIVVGILAVLLFTGQIDVLNKQSKNPEQYIASCIRDYVSDAVEIMLPQGGYINPESYKLYEDSKVGYLCYAKDFYENCVNQEPVYLKHLEDEIKDYIQPKIEDCFGEITKENENNGFDVEIGSMDLDVELEPGKIKVSIERNFKIFNQEMEENYNKFRETILSSLYDLAVVAQRISSEESVFCNFDFLEMSLYYPEFRIDRKQVGSQETLSEIYIITEKKSGGKLMIAIRSCARPGGLG